MQCVWRWRNLCKYILPISYLFSLYNKILILTYTILQIIYQTIIEKRLFKLSSLQFAVIHSSYSFLISWNLNMKLVNFWTDFYSSAKKCWASIYFVSFMKRFVNILPKISWCILYRWLRIIVTIFQKGSEIHECI